MPEFRHKIDCRGRARTKPDRPNPVSGTNGYTLIEMIIVVLILGILAAIAFKSMGPTMDRTRTEETMQEMEQLAWAIAGNPSLASGGIRTDYGYVGDVGALPPDWEALVSNPGGYSTWNGPYIRDEFSSGSDSEFKLDAWGRPYTSPNAIAFSSNGGPSPLTRKIANAIDDLLNNNITLSISDLDFTPPDAAHRDSIKALLTYPDGAGGLVTVTGYPGTDGLVRFHSIPIGIHTLKMIYIPAADTVMRKIAVNPGHDFYADLQYFGEVW